VLTKINTEWLVDMNWPPIKEFRANKKQNPTIYLIQ